MHVDVENIGERDGDYVCLLFARPPDAGLRGRPRQLLVDFHRVRVRGGAAAQLSFGVRASSLALANSADGEWEVAVGEWIFFLSEQDNPESETVVVRIDE